MRTRFFIFLFAIIILYYYHSQRFKKCEKRVEEILNELFSIAETYNKKIKLLNVEFNHSWEELDADIDGYKT